VDRDTFWHLHDLISGDPIFVSTGIKPQRPVQFQLAAFLCRSGAVSGIKTSSIVGIAEGTAYNYMHRVVRAFRNIRADHLAWPGIARRQFLSGEMGGFGFPRCIGIGDGTYIRLVDKPWIDGWSYWCRKKFYAVPICDHRGIFIGYEFGWPGSVDDSTVFRESDLWLNKADYFEGDEYILVDKGMSPPVLL
ncbi:hypothetical protein FIBSPDRAFT_719687, partial [Athelia psychrophila]